MKRFYNNTIMSGAFSKALRVLALLCVLLGVSGSAWGATITGGTTLYLDASGGDWTRDGARFAAYVCNGSSTAKWYSMTKIEGTIYKFTVDNGESHKNVIFCRMDGSTTENNWGNKWNQTKDLTWPGDKNLYTPISKNQDDNNDNYWSTYSGGGDTPSVDVKCYLIGSFNNWTTSDANYEMTINPENSEEYIIQGVTLSANAEVKVYYNGIYYGYDITVESGDGVSISKSDDQNKNIKFANAGTYDFYFDKSGSMKIYVGKNAGGGGDAEEKCYLIGSFNNWKESDSSTEMTKSPSSGTYSISIRLEAGVSFKVFKTVGETKYYYGWKNHDYTADNTVEWEEGLSFSSSGADDYNIVVNQTGTYDIYFKTDNAIWIEGEVSGGGGGAGTGSEFDFVLDTKTNNFGGWIANDQVFAVFRENAGGQTGATQQVLMTICPADNRIAHCSIPTPPNDKSWTEVYVYSDDKNDAIAEWNGTKNCMVITQWGKMSNSSGGCNMTTFTGDCDGTSGGGGGEGGGGESSTNLAFKCLYLNTGGADLWNKSDQGAPNFYLYLFFNETIRKSVKATVCPNSPDLFYAEVPEGTWNGYLWIRKDPNNNVDPAVDWNAAGVWNQTNNCSVLYDYTVISGWGQGDFSNSMYAGSCGCAGEDEDLEDDFGDYEKGTSVLLSYEPKETVKGSWTLSAYLEATCSTTDIKKYGFLLCETDKKGGCIPTVKEYSYKVNATSKTAITQGDSFTALATDLNNAWYGYRAFVVADGDTILSPNTKYFNNQCEYVVSGDTIYVTIDNSITVNNDCELIFMSFDEAWRALKKIPEICSTSKVVHGWAQDAITLNKPVVMQVVPTGKNYSGIEAVGATGGDMRSNKAIFFRNINIAGGKELVVRTIDKSGPRASLQHVAIRRSKNITLDYLNIVGTSAQVEDADNALDIDNGEGDGNLEGKTTDWNKVKIGDETTKANLIIKNCEIVSYGFTCIHVAAYDGITFENNEIRAKYDFVGANAIEHHSYSNQANNTALWGASAKFLNSKNIAFIRNNFTGQHATSILLQGAQEVLVYNNVFWHDNAVQSNVNTVAIIRLISYGGAAESNPLQDIGIYYNTMFLNDNSVGEGYYHYFDFFRLGGAGQTTEGMTSNFKPATIEFDYNNCYSYDTDVYGKNNNTSNKLTYYLGYMNESDWCGSFKYNNFWSKWDENQTTKPIHSAFTLGGTCEGTANSFTNVENLVCKTSPETPGALVIKGDALNRGTHIISDASGILTLDMQKQDRLGNPRPYNPNDLEGKGTYTIGAYQQTEGTEVSKIIWNGNVSTEWDNRNNWCKPNGQLVTCVDILTADLEVIIPAPVKTQYPVPAGGVIQYPKLPAIAADADFSKRATDWSGEEVSAGKGKIDNPTKIADKITMEYGAALLGVEELAKEGETERYTSASTQLVVPRKKWILVGPIIRPFNEKGVADDMLSGHYFIEKQLPHVWMHEAEWTGSAVSWNSPFPDLNRVVPANKVFAIQIPDMYGTNMMFTAERYNKYFATSFNGEEPITYTFTGRFSNEGALPTYTDLTEGQPVLLNNSYPANINIEELTAKGGTVQIYDYNRGSFREWNWAPENGENSTHILAQHGFVYTPGEGTTGTLTIPADAYENSNTEHRSAVQTSPEVRVMINNANASAGSDIKLTIDWTKDDAVNYNTDAPKVFSAQETKLPDLYVVRYNAKWAGLTVPTYNEPIPLGIRVSAENQTFVFSLNKVVDMTTVLLEDRLEGKTYDLLAGETCTVSNLAIGDCEGRFFLNVGADQYIEDDDVTTDIEDVVTDNNIYIYSKNNNIVVSCSSEVQLQTVIVNDMSGRTATYNVSGQYAEFNLPVVQGVYLVKVIGDTATKTGKVILK